jgi:hypothetical protein
MHQRCYLFLKLDNPIYISLYSLLVDTRLGSRLYKLLLDVSVSPYPLKQLLLAVYRHACAIVL